MINQKRIDGLLKYMAELGQQQMIIRNPLLIKYLLGYAPRGGDRATILYVSQTNGIKLIANYLTTWPKGLEDEIEIVTHGDQDSVAEEIAKIRGISYEEVVAQTEQNAKVLFGIS